MATQPRRLDPAHKITSIAVGLTALATFVAKGVPLAIVVVVILDVIGLIVYCLLPWESWGFDASETDTNKLAFKRIYRGWHCLFLFVLLFVPLICIGGSLLINRLPDVGEYIIASSFEDVAGTHLPVNRVMLAQAIGTNVVVQGSVVGMPNTDGTIQFISTETVLRYELKSAPGHLVNFAAFLLFVTGLVICMILTAEKAAKLRLPAS